MHREMTQTVESARSKPKKKILLCIASERPQIVTQTIYGLACLPQAWVPDEVVVITSQSGAEKVAAGLVANAHFEGVYRMLGTAAGHDPLLSIEVMTRARQSCIPVHSLDAVRDRRDIGNFILKTVQRITDDDDTQLCISLGPDRNVVACFFAGHALSLLGRPQDRLVQLSSDDEAGDPIESFYPSCANAGCDRAMRISDVPFARIEGIASVRNLARQVDYSTLCHGLDGNAHLQVSSAFTGLQFRFSNAFDLRCDSSHRQSGPRFEPRAAALYAFYAKRAQANEPFVSDEQVLDEPDHYLAMYDACLVGGDRKSERGARALTREVLRSARSRIGRTLKALVKNGASYSDYRIYAQRNELSYGLDLHPDQIAFVDWAETDPWMSNSFAEARC